MDAKKKSVCILFGPPSDPCADSAVLSRFFTLPGAHILCGGTTARIGAEYLGKPLAASLSFPDPDVPPVGKLDGADLVTEGIVTMQRVLALLESGEVPGSDGAGQIVTMLHAAEKITFFVGTAQNPGHLNVPSPLPDKVQLAEKIEALLQSMGKETELRTF